MTGIGPHDAEEVRRVAIFDAGHPPGIAFIRSLGAMNVPITVFSSSRLVAGRYSRFTTEFRSCPDVEHSDDFAAWLTEQMGVGQIDLVAPTSDYVMYGVAEAVDRLGGTSDAAPSPAALRNCLFKSRFSLAMEAVGFPTPPTGLPNDLDDARALVEEIGYPVVLKPRSHVGIGTYRGTLVRNSDELAEAFRELELKDGVDSVLRHESQLALPLVQHYLDSRSVDVVSISGCLGRDGSVLALGHCRKIEQWPPDVGIGTLFESLPEQWFTEQAVDAVRRVLGSGLFELEVLADRQTGDAWPIDLNPRAFGQISLDIARGNDLPSLWYSSLTGTAVEARSPHRRRRPRYWRQGVHYYTGASIRVLRGPNRIRYVKELYRRLRYPSVGAVMTWYDLGPAIIFAVLAFRHPGGLLKPFWRAHNRG